MADEQAKKVVKLQPKKNTFTRRKLGELLVETGLLAPEQLTEALKIQETTGKRLGEILIEMKFVSEEEMAFALAMQLKIPYIDLSDYPIQDKVLEIIPREISYKFTCVAIDLNNNILNVAMSDPLDLIMIKDLQFLTGYNIQPSISTPSQIINVLQHHYNPEKTLADCFKFRNKIGLDTVIEAIRFYRERRKIKVDDLVRYATVCRVYKIMRPYLEAIL